MKRAFRTVIGVAVAGVVLISGAVADSAGAAPRTHTSSASNQFAPFLRHWYGHDRILSISTDGVTKEKYLSGCCAPISRYTLQLSDVHRDANGHPVAHITVTKVRIDKGGYRFPGVHKGSTGRAVIKHHIFRDSLFKIRFCDEHAKAGACGA